MVYPHIEYRGRAYSAPPATDIEAPARARELDSRAGDGIHVRLLWHPCDGHLSVAVEDIKAGLAFELPVRDGDRPLDVFQHPYAYAARLHAPSGYLSLESPDSQIAA